MTATRVLLLVPGDRPDRFARAMAAAPDAVVIDLEDSVAPPNKATARTHALGALTSATDQPRPGPSAPADDVPLLGVRLNALSTAAGVRDLAALTEVDGGPGLVVLAKVESAPEVRLCAQVLGGGDWRGKLVCVIESGWGVERAAEIAAADPHVTALGFGGVDLAAALRAAPEWEAMLPARGRVVWAAAAAGVEVLDVPCLDLDSDEKLAEECRRARAMGFTGKIAIHPRQVAGIRAGFTPTEREVLEARRILAAAGDGGAVRLGNTMVDAAVLRSARQLVERAEGRA